MNSNNLKAKLTRRLIAPALALATIGAFGAYECLKPAAAHASSVATSSATAPLDDNSVSALLSLDQAMEALAARVTPATVNVAVTSKTKVDTSDQGMSEGLQDLPPGFRQFFGQGFGQRMQPQNRIEHGVGSGVIISPDGYIVTNNHVVDGAVDVSVTMSDRRIFPAKVVGTDPMTDLAVLKINGTNFPNVPLGDSTKLRPGQTVLAFGNPYNFRFTVTRGIVSALNRQNPDLSDRRKPGEFIQTDAAINPGNSGGPLVDAHGEVVGINTFLISDSGAFSGMGFAIPTQIVRPIVNEIIRSGKVTHAYIGVSINDVTPENSKFFNMTKAQGAVVSEVTPDSPGAKAGLKVGDVITKMDGKDVSDAGQLQANVTELEPGTTVHLDVLREGKDLTVPVTVEALGKANNSEKIANNSNGKARWGIGLADLDPDTRQQVQAPDNVHGAVVAQVQPGSPADNAGLSSGDIIQRVNHKNISSAQDAKQALSSIANGQDALVLVWSNGGSTFRVMHSGNNNS
jgi:serine protease Do